MTAAEPTPLDQFRAVVKEWLDAYPVDMFPVPPKASTLTREQRIVRSNDSAAMGRRMATRLLQQIDELEREWLKESAEDTARLDAVQRHHEEICSWKVTSWRYAYGNLEPISVKADGRNCFDTPRAAIDAARGGTK